MKKLTKKDITIFSLIIIAFIWLSSITIFLFNFYQGQESNYWYMLRDVKDQGLKIERLQEQIK